MTRRMLINARVPEEIRIAIIDGDTLENYQVEVAERGLTRGNIYRGTIVSIQPSLNAAFIDYGAERHGFLPIQDVVPAAYYRKPDPSSRPRIEGVLERGRTIVVQVTREPEGTKGAALTTNLSLAGRYMVLTPFNDSQGVSRKVEDEEMRRKLKEQVNKLDRPQGSGIIIRTNALGQSKAALNRDLNALLRLWKRISSDARKGQNIRLLYSDQDLILRALRDHLDNSVEEVLTDTEEAHKKVQEYMRAFMPRSKTRLVRYTDRRPLFARFGLDPQIESIYERSVDLPSGGSIVIDRTEALTAIDVNSGRSTRASSQEETALSTNLEAAQEVARQLRLRDLGGLLVVDFIDMDKRSNRRRVEKAMKDSMKPDKARHTVGRISMNGLLEINRQRVQQALSLRTHRACPTCSGTGRIASRDLVSLRLLRRIDARAADGFKGTVRISLHPELADALQNTRRMELVSLEREFGIKIEVIASSALHRSQEEVEWIQKSSEGEDAASAKSREQPASIGSSPAAKSTDQGKTGSQRPRRRSRRGKKAKSSKSESNGKPVDSTQSSKPDVESRQAGTDTSSSDKKTSSRKRRPRRGRRRQSKKGRKPEAATTPGSD